MSAISIDSAEAAARNSSDIGAWDFTKDVLSNRPYYAFEAPKIILEVVSKVFTAVDATLLDVFDVFGSTESIASLCQDVVVIPGKCKSLYEKTVGFWDQSETGTVLINETRKFIGLVGSTIGDYVGSCLALQKLHIPVSRIVVFSDKVGSIGSTVGSMSRIFDYAIGDVSVKSKHELTPTQEKIRKPIAESKNLWNLARDVSIFALSILCLAGCTVCATTTVVLPGAILGSRMVGYYREIQLNEIDANHPKMVKAKQVLK